MRHTIRWNGKTYQVDLVARESVSVQISSEQEEFTLSLGSGLKNGQGRICLDGGRFVPYFVSTARNGIWVTLDGETYFFEKVTQRGSSEPDHGGFVAPMPGKIVSVAVQEGQKVEAGTVLVILEAMKMEHRIDAPSPGVVKALHVQEQQLVEQGFVLLDFEAENEG